MLAAACVSPSRHQAVVQQLDAALAERDALVASRDKAREVAELASAREHRVAEVAAQAVRRLRTVEEGGKGFLRVQDHQIVLVLAAPGLFTEEGALGPDAGGLVEAVATALGELPGSLRVMGQQPAEGEDPVAVARRRSTGFAEALWSVGVQADRVQLHLRRAPPMGRGVELHWVPPEGLGVPRWAAVDAILADQGAPPSGE